MSTKQLLAQLNDLRIETGKPPLKSWKGSHSDLVKTIEALTPKKKSEPKLTIVPKTKTVEKHVPTVSDWCIQHGFNPKVARAKLRKSGLKKEGPWVLTPEVKSVLTSQ